MPQNFEDLKGKVVSDINNNLYVVLKDIYNTLTTQRMILYANFYDENELFVLSKSVFLAEVDKEKYPNATQEFGFQLVDKDISSHTSNNSIKKIKPIIRSSINFNKQIVQYFKGNFYIVIDLAYDSQNKENMILYRSIDTEKYILTIPQNFFLAKVNKKNYPNSQQNYLFEVVDSNTVLHTFPERKDLVPLKGRVIRWYNNIYYVVLDLPQDPLTGEDFVLLKGYFGKYDTLLISRNSFLSELNSHFSSKYKTKYVYDLIEPDKVPKKAPFKDWLIRERSCRFKHNLFWGLVLGGTSICLILQVLINL